MNNKKEYKIASLFTGCGGLDLGAIGGFTFQEKNYPRLNTKIVFANDIDNDAVTVYNSNKSLFVNCSDALLGDIRDIKTEDIPDFDILIAGFPCQPFSNAGNRKGVHDDNGRGTLFEVCERVLKDKIESGKKPAAFLFENVRGILSSKMPDGKTVPDEIIQRMEAIDYNVSIKLVCSSDYGVPQKRYRVLIIGVDKDIKKFDFDKADKLVNDLMIPSEKHGTGDKLVLGNILKDIDDCGPYWEYSKTTQDMVNKIGSCKHGKEALDFFKQNIDLKDMPENIKEGRSWKNIPPEQLTPRFLKIYNDPKKYHAPKFFRRFAYGEINGTITASAQPENCGITHPIENRRFSVKEIQRIQSFPDTFSFDAINLQARYKVIGNAVPPVMSWIFVRSLINTLEEK
ncbi:DNA (cytosine-5-)-methyltransferase [Treponema sp.]|uniref:DNA cytosine methyltransferase n=1 Tax=Treponema sp. TaxID=166 RepID=UPI00298ECEAA|nr:DNA (cytosine-5-)-methyltransferase [Treponema sp.]MCQ2240006.1 DNA cytosine methyltransferase [Treponema sp.]